MAQFAERMAVMEKPAAIIKNVFHAMSAPDLISFAGGAPARECLPMDILREITNDVLRRDRRGVEALAYGPVVGIKDLREVVVSDLLAPKGVKAKPEEIIITSGGIEAVYLICMAFINPGDIILVESPTFFHCVETFAMLQAKTVAVDMDSNGMVLEDLEKKIKKYKPKMVYVIPTFQNPTGITLSLERRQKIAELGSKYDVIILEDDPYRDIRYSGEDLQPIKAFDETGHTVLANSFSKIFSPGSRLGYTLATPEITSKLADIKSATNSHTALLPQVLCAEFFKRGYYPDHHTLICGIHKERRDVMIECIDQFFPKGTKRTFPDGGLFTWVELPGGLNAKELLVEATTNPEIKVAYVAGEGFFTEGHAQEGSFMRLSFSAVPPDAIRTGAERLGKLFNSKLGAC